MTEQIKTWLVLFGGLLVGFLLVVLLIAVVPSSLLSRACRKTTLSVTETSRSSSFLSAGAVCSILPASIPFLLTCRPVPGPASACSDCRRGETEDLPSPASARDVPWAC